MDITSQQVFTPPPKGKQDSPDQAPLKGKGSSPSPNTHKWPRSTKSDSHLDRRFTSFSDRKPPQEREPRISAYDQEQQAKIRELISAVDKFEGEVQKVKPFRSMMYDLQIDELKELIAKQEKTLGQIETIERDLDKQMSASYYIEKKRAVHKMPQFGEYEQSAVYQLNEEYEKTERMLEELLERGSRMQCTDFLKILKMKQTIRKTLKQEI